MFHSVMTFIRRAISADTPDFLPIQFQEHE